MTKVIFMGTPDFSVLVLRRLITEGFDVIAVVTQPDRPVGRKRILTPPPVKVEAEQHNIPVFQPEKIRLPEETEKILALEPDLIVTAAYGQILPAAILEVPKLGCINVHASLLPELRGGAPIHYAILEGKKKTGITIMYMVEKLDAGDIISQKEIPITEEDDVGTLFAKLSETGADLLAATLPELIAGKIIAQPQNHDEATYAYNIKREQEKINWNDSGEVIFNQIRGLRPWPIAYTTLNGQVLKIWKAEKVALSSTMEPGRIAEVLEDGIIISTGNQIGIKVLELQPAGKKKMSVEQYLRGAGAEISAGLRIGQTDE
ncbi:methionyl-tRNA formyltransferase [Lederbergia lenta]|uniref:Methionyl-tRNA formyltransferase n=1 Tax=Lederbergia lenta TaxID=1467 RepID=A0A2X4WBM9_LEDLE|nr:methionyl-tRNA formyltransferase [Lederbergia lenta]MEC2324231.1 methionyl-tRNA formyltransferase [Lederbergia lenta]SQI60453.1 methionyl-tRNA formyltransferase [Lederbergia lenta]